MILEHCLFHQTAFHLAIINQNLEVVKLFLLLYNLDVNMQSIHYINL